ncbi:MAG: hypothetical protein L0212_08130 [Acidobacteria bacterium]|nr:hypothetical protein [Acidobacteriota bacterium]
MARPLTVAGPREHGAPANDSSADGNGNLRGMLATAEYWNEEATADSEGPGTDAPTGPAEASGDPTPDLLRENEELRALVEALQRQQEEGGGDGGWQERQREFESLLEEKSEVIRSLHQKMQELQARPTAPALTPKEEELIALSDELERERCQLEQERRNMEEERAQLREDEKIMMQQMKEMEVQMARERADLARQRNDLQRLHTEVHHELELAARDAGLRERLAPLQRRHQEMNNRRGAEPQREQRAAPAAPQSQLQPQVKETDSNNGLLRRLFG